MRLRIRLVAFAEDVRSSYWGVPALLALVGFAAGLALVYVDAVLGDAWLGRLEWFYGSRPEGARSLLSTVAGSTITVAGVVFSITLAAVTFASGQYGPRLLSTFVRDRGNQVTLGVFIGTFLYCLVVLRTIRSAAEVSAGSAGHVRDAFVPHLAMFGALALAVLSIGVLIYFVHHVTDAIHVNNVIARIGKGLLADIAERDAKGEEVASDAECPPPRGRRVPAGKTGYVEVIDEDALLAIACESDAVLRVVAMPGDFVHRSGALLTIERGGGERLDRCADLFSIGRKRSAAQDLRFSIDELVELAARALSPGVNDPFTAVACIDWLGAALIDLSTMHERPSRLRDADGTVRVIVPRLSFASYLAQAIDPLRAYTRADPIAAAHLRRTLDTVQAAVPDPHQHRLIGAARDRTAGAIQGVR